MLIIDSNVKKELRKNKIPKDIFINIYNALIEVDKSKDIGLFDIKEMKGNYSIDYYRIRKGKYRAIFYFDENNTILDFIGKREEVYKLWKQ